MNRASALLSVWVALASAACVSDPCDPATDRPRCEGQVLWTCPEAGVDQVVATRWIKRTCAPEQACVIASGGTLGLCAMDAEPAEACAGGSTAVCESGKSRLHCSAGYATGRSPCISCTADERGVTCEGGFGMACAGPSDCASGLTCNERGLCV